MMLRLTIMVLLLNLSLPVWAAENAGQVLFVAGSVTAEREETVELAKADPIFEQDVIVTGARSRGQLLMRDGAKFALRADTQFVVEEYFFAGEQRVQADGSVVAASQDSAVTRLIKGGFRTITGAIGSDSSDNYIVETPGATLGVRGTHYTVVWCAADCQLPPGISNAKPILDGLYIGVTEGIVSVKNLTGEYALQGGEFVFVKDQNTSPVRLPETPSVLIDTYPTNTAQEEEAAQEIAETIAALGEAPTVDGVFDTTVPRPTAPAPAKLGNTSGGGSGSNSTGTNPDPQTNDGSTSGFQAEPVIPILTDGGPITDGKLPNTRPVAMSSSSIPGINPTAFTSVSSTGTRTFRGNDLSAFQAPPGTPDVASTYSIGTAMILDDGFDPATGIGWGRWSAGVASVMTPGGSTVMADLTEQSLHWVYGPEPVGSTTVPITGTANFTLIVGNTDPTDTIGNRGVLGNASLMANFTTSTVTSDLLLAVGGRDWQASGTGSITSSLFNGLYNTVLIGGQTNGSGSFSGFFGAPGANGLPGGAGLTYGLFDGQGVSVSGAVVFGQPTP